MRTPIQIDPAGCGCTECLTGEYVPLDLATAEQMQAMLAGTVRNATSEDFTLVTIAKHYISDTDQPAFCMTLHATYCGKSWIWETS
jgi:hypothetical protein